MWFELGDGEDRREALSVAETTASHRGPAEAALEVHLLGASPPLIEATIEQGDALLRELALLSLGGELDDTLPEGWQLPQFDVSPILAAAEAAAASGQAKADLALDLPAGAQTAATERLCLVDQADALAREGRLLSAPALPEVAVCRHWIYSQVAEQAAGFPPQAWELPQQLEPTRGAARLLADELERLERESAARSLLTTPTASSSSTRPLVKSLAGYLRHWSVSASPC